MKSKAFVLTAALAVMLVSVPAVLSAPLPGTLYKISVVGSATRSEGRAITPDGEYVGFSDAASNEGGMWDVTNGSRTIYCPVGTGPLANDVVGIAYRNYTTTQDLIAVGDSTGGTQGVTYFNSTDGGATWTPKLRRTGTTHSLPVASAIAASATQADAWYGVWTQLTGTSKYITAEKGSGAPALPVMEQKSSTDDMRLNGISGYGVAVGYRTTAGVTNTYVGVYGQPISAGLFNVNTLNGVRGTLYGISANSTTSDNIAGGFGPHASKTGNWAFVVEDWTNGTSGTGTVTEMPTFVPSAAYATNSVVYGLSKDGTLAVGMDYTLGTGEKAVIWIWDGSSWNEIDLTQWASDHGILDGFSRLTRAYAVGVSDGNPVITGYGDHTDGVRGFVLTLPEPATLCLLLLGLPMLRRRR